MVAVAAVAATAAAAVLITQGGSAHAELAIPGDSSPSGGTAELAGPGAHGTVLSYSLCVSKGVDVVISRVEPVGGGGGLKISDFTLLDTDDVPGLEGWVPTAIPAAYSERGTRTVGAACGAGNYRTLFLEVQAPEAPVSSFESVKVSYRGGDEPLEVPFSMRICQVPLDSAACQNG